MCGNMCGYTHGAGARVPAAITWEPATMCASKPSHPHFFAPRQQNGGCTTRFRRHIGQRWFRGDGALGRRQRGKGVGGKRAGQGL